MSSSFDATARINLDIRSFAQGAQAVTKSGGQMEKIFQNLNQVLSKVAVVESGLAAKLRTSLGVYNSISSATKNYASAVAALHKNESQGANGAKLMTQAFQQLKSALAQVQGMSEKEYQRLSRTVTLYQKLANTIHQLASAQKSMASITQNAVTAQQKEDQAKQKAAETSRRLTLEEQKLALAKQKLAAASQQAAAKQAAEEQKLAIQRAKLAQSATRMAQEEERMAQSRQRLSSATKSANDSNVSFSASTFALRNTIGELESSFQQLFQTLIKVPMALAGAAISQEAAFAQVARVVGEAEAASVGLLTRFQEIAQNAPISFEEVSRIGQLGAAIGVSASNLGDFTETIVKFSLTTGVATEEATLLLGRIAQMEDVPISEMEQLGSSILYLGTVSAATEQEILRVNASIATVSNLFGLTAQQTAGLSAALATLQVRPELSRGALTRVFNELTTAVSDGGTELSKLAKVMGMTDGQVTKLASNPATRGDFLLSFVKGLSNAAGAGGDVQGVLRALGINAVRDIDVFSRLANNFDVVQKAFDDANVQFARGTELQRQSQGIYNTTSAELQNLSDAFKTLLASLGGPLATAVGTIARGLGNVIESIAHMGPVVPIFGTLAAVAVAGASGWLIYQVALAKTIQSLIATRELQKNLGVSTLSLRTAVDVYRNGLQGTTAAQAAAANAQRQLTTSTDALAASLAASSGTIRGYSLAASQSASGLSAMSTASLNAARGQDALFASTLATQTSLRQLNAQATASAVAMASVSNTNRNLALTQTQMANSSRLFAGQTTIAATAVTGLNTSTARIVPTTNLMSASMRNAATAGVQMGAGMEAAVVSSATASTAFTRAATGITASGMAARAASFAFGPWGMAIATAGILLGPLVSQMLDFRSEAEQISSAAMSATGGTQALANAIKADTDAAVSAAGSVQKYNEIVRSGNQEQLNALGIYRTVTVSKNDMAAADQRTAENAKKSARETLTAIETIKGTKDALQGQAEGHGLAAEAARRYLRDIDTEKGTVDKLTAALGENTVAIGQNVKQWLMDTAQAALSQSKLADGSDKSRDSLKLLSESGLDVGNVLTTSLTKPKAAVDQLNKVISEMDTKSKQTGASDPFVPYDEGAQSAAGSADRLKNFLIALRTVIQSEGSESAKSALSKKLLKDALDATGQSAASASGHIKLTKAALEDLDTDADSAQQAIDDLNQTFEKFGSPLDAFKNAATSAFGSAKDAMDKFSLSSKGGLDAYLAQLEKIAKAQRDWAANLIKISTTLGPDIAEQFRKLGPEAAPAVAQLANLSAAELKKLGPRLSEIGADATSDLAASIIQNSGKIKNATLQTRTVIADVFGNVVNKAKTAQDFAQVSTQYSKLVTQLNGLKGVNIDISANDAKAIKSLQDLSLYIDLVGSKKIKPSVAIDIIKAQGDIERLAAIIQEAEASGKLDPKGKAALDKLLFETQLAQLAQTVQSLSAEGKLDAKGKGKLSDTEYRAKVLALTEFLASSEGSGLLNPKGKAQLNDSSYRAQIENLAKLILGDEAAGKFDVDGDGKLSTSEFMALLQALKGAVADANRGKLSPKGTVTLANVGGFKGQLNGIVQAAYGAGANISRALTRSATVTVGYTYRQNNSPPRVGQAATGGWINGPGGPKADKVPMMLSNGEFVVNSAAAQRFGALLEVINRSGGRGFSGIAKRLYDTGVTGGSKQIRVTRADSGTTMLGGGNMMARTPPESVSVSLSQMVSPQSGPTNVFNINNQYPQAEPTSVTVNRSLAYAATISGV